MKKIYLHIKQQFKLDKEFFKDKDKIKVVLIHQDKHRYENDLVVLKYGDLLRLSDGLLQRAEILSD